MNKLHMFQPLQIGRMKVKNRIVFPPMNTNLTSEEGYVTPALEEYYVRRAKGGVGLIVLEAATIDANSRNHPGQPVLYDRKHVAGWAHLTERLHRYDVRVSIELVHYGSEASIPPRESPSAATKYTDDPGEILTLNRIHEIQRQFTYSAKLAKQCGMDAITLHACHGYLIAEFLSPAFNRRTDEYGGCLENRCRFLTETIALCRAEVGPFFPILVRFSADEFLKNGLDMEQAVQIAKLLEANGVDAIDISAGQPSAYLMTTPPNCLAQGHGLLVPYSAAIRKAVKVPVFTAIGIREPEEVEEILESGKADMVVLGRPQLADPDYVRKVAEGRTTEIRQCLSCEFCLDTLDDDRRICCAVNPETGRETEFRGISRTNVKKKIIVVGGGPGGLEAARVAALRGHDVILLERRGELGGTMNAAKIPPHKEMIGRLVEWYKAQMRALNVDVRLNTEATEENVNALRPDALILAAGAHYIKRIPGSDGANVINAYDALTEPEKVGRRIVIIGGGASGAETADYFSGPSVELRVVGAESLGGPLEFCAAQVATKNEHEISILEMLPEICADQDVFCKDVMLATLRANGVQLHPSCRVERIETDGVRAYDMAAEREIFLPADTVVLAGGLRSNAEDVFQNTEYPVIRVGDAIRAGKIHAAIYTAYCAAREL